MPLCGTEVKNIPISGRSRVLQKEHYGGLGGLEKVGIYEFYPRFGVVAGDEAILALWHSAAVEKRAPGDCFLVPIFLFEAGESNVVFIIIPRLCGINSKNSSGGWGNFHFGKIKMYDQYSFGGKLDAATHHHKIIRAGVEPNVIIVRQKCILDGI